MENIILLIFPIALFLITFYKCTFVKKGFTDDILSLNQAKMIQVFACFGVILHHVTQRVTSYGVFYKGPITIFSSMGILFTSIFFFFSGFGIITSVINKPDYLDTFLTHRLPIVLVPFFITNIINVLVRIFVTHVPTDSTDILRSVFGLVLLNGNGWYIVEIVILYIAFYILFKLIKNRDVAIVLLCCFSIVLIMHGSKSGHDYTDIGDLWFKGEWWYNATIVFDMGVLFARFKEPVVDFLKRRYPLLLAATTVLFFVSFYVEEIVIKRYGYYQSVIRIGRVNAVLVTLISQSVLCLIFTLFMLLVNMKISFHNLILDFMSKIIMEVFLVHGLFVNLATSRFRSVHDFWKYIIVISGGIIAGILLHYVDKQILAVISKLFNMRKKSYLDVCERDLIRERREEKSKKRNRIIIVAASVSISLFFILNLIVNYVLRPVDCYYEMKKLRESKVSDIVHFGRFEQDYLLRGKERINWIVLEKSDDEMVLISEKGLAGSSYYQKHSEIGWTDSDIYEYLNNDMYNEMFSSNEKINLVQNVKTGELVSLLTPDEATRFFGSDEERELDISEVSKRQGVNINEFSKVNEWDYKDHRSSWWWLKGDEKKSIYAPIVNADGEIEENVKVVNKPNGAVRPVIRVKIK